jgi:uncharacterized membrane protein (UPF0127 family)
MRRQAEQQTARRLRALPTIEIKARRFPVASTELARLMGLALLDRDEAGIGLLIPRCRSVHTFGMRFELDLLFLDGDLQPVSIRRGVPSRRIAVERRAHSVLEEPTGAPGGTR